jgi:DNA adenine methylase
MSNNTAESPSLAEENLGRSSCRPFLKWAGGKTQLLPHLIHRIPNSFNRYIEPFIGGGALFFALQPKVALIADCNQELINCYQVVRTDVEALIEELKVYRYDKEMYYAVRELDRRPDFGELSRVKRAARLIYLNKTCFNGLYRVNSKGYFNVPFGTYTDPTIVDAENLRACSKVLQRTVIQSGNFEQVLEIAEAGDFVYFDPPYAPSSGTADFTSYSKEGFDDAAQEMLLLVCLQLNQRGVKWMVSNSNTTLIQELYRGFKVEPVGASRAINSKASKRGSVIELLIRNF